MYSSMPPTGPVTGARDRARSVQRGFTLIELLVVISIIAVLAAILFPALASARGRARTATCQSSLKQLASAFDLYLQAWDDQYPNSWQVRPSGYGELNHSFWDVQVAPYVKSDGVFACPSNDTESYSVHQPFDSRGRKTRRVTYAMNNQLLRCPSGAYRFDYLGDPPEPAGSTDIDQPAETILLAEKMLDEPNHGPASADQPGNQSEEIDVWYHITGPGVDPTDWNTSWGVARDLHEHGTNFLFVDSHVRHLRLQDTFRAPAAASVRAPSAADAPSAVSGGAAGPSPPALLKPVESPPDFNLWTLNKSSSP